MPNAERPRVVLGMLRLCGTDLVDSEAFSHKKDSQSPRIRSDWRLTVYSQSVFCPYWIHDPTKSKGKEIPSKLSVGFLASEAGMRGNSPAAFKKQTSRGIFGTMIWRMDLMEVLWWGKAVAIFCCKDRKVPGRAGSDGHVAMTTKK